MKQDKRISLREEVEKEARKIEQEISENPNLKDVKVSDKMERELFLRIKEYEKKRAEKLLSEEDRKALLLGRELINKEKEVGQLCEVNKEYHKHLNENEKGNGKKSKVFRMPRKKRIIAALVAVLVLVVGTSVNSIGSKSYLKVLWDRMRGEESMQITSVKDMDTQDSADGEEVTAYRKIRQELGVLPVRFGYKPKSMLLEKIDIDEEQKSAQLFYKYNGEVIRYMIYLNDADSSLSEKKEDRVKDKFNIETAKQTLEVNEYEVQESTTSRFIASFSYKGTYYQLKGIMSKEEFIEIIKNLIYFD